MIKLWKYHPGQMNRSEQVQFILGVLLFILYPLILLLIGREYLLAAIALASAVSFSYLLRRNICNHCINFSCPLNHVQPETRQSFLAHNPVITQGWEVGSPK